MSSMSDAGTMHRDQLKIQHVFASMNQHHRQHFSLMPDPNLKKFIQNSFPQRHSSIQFHF